MGRPRRLIGVLIGRKVECERIERLVAEARDGRGGAVLLRGEAGIGKTSLLEHARGLAGEDLVLAARGIETEAEIPYAGLWDLLGPVLDLSERLPEAQATALGQALALGPEGTPARFAVPAAVLGLLSVATEERAAICLIDDVQWLDAPSVEAIVFAARRLGGESVAMLLAAREGDRPPRRHDRRRGARARPARAVLRGRAAAARARRPAVVGGRGRAADRRGRATRWRSSSCRSP